MPTNRTVLDTIGQKCLDEHTFLNATLVGTKKVDDGKLYYFSTDPMAIGTCLQVSLSAYLTDALARAHNTVPTYINVEGHLDDPYHGYPKDFDMSQGIFEDVQYLQSYDDGFSKYRSNLTLKDFKDATKFTEIRMKMSRYGYGYGFQDSILIYVGAIILLLHAVLSVTYIAWVVSKAKHPGTDDRTVGKLLVMGIQSGNLGSSGAVEMGSDKGNMKKMWKTKYGLKSVGSDTLITKTTILEKI